MEYKREVDLIKYLPPFLRRYYEMQKIMEAENPEFYWLFESLTLFFSNSFILTCDEEGIRKFEEFLGVPHDEGLDLESRRKEVLIIWGASAPYTFKKLLEFLRKIDKGAHAEINYGKYFLFMSLFLESEKHRDRLDTYLRKIVPANIAFFIQMKLRQLSDPMHLHIANTNFNLVKHAHQAERR